MYGSRLSGEFITGLQGFLRVADANKRNGLLFVQVCQNQKN
jgi:hypothetical protein